MTQRVLNAALVGVLMFGLACSGERASGSAQPSGVTKLIDDVFAVSSGITRVLVSSQGLESNGVHLKFGAPTRPQVRNGRVELQRDGFVEWVRAEQNGVEHGFDVPTAPAGDLVLSTVIAGTQVTQLSNDAVQLGTVRYTDAHAVDAVGTRWPVEVRWQAPSSTLEVRVAAADVQRAKFPLVVDPLFTSVGWEWTSSLPTTYMTPTSAPAGAGGPQLTEDWGDNFTGAVGAAGDLNGDGFTDLAIGEPLYPGVLPDGGAGPGSFLIFYGSSLGLSTSGVRFNAPAGVDNGSRFGLTVARAGDVNDDGYDDLMVGAPEKDNLAPDGGLVIAGGAAYLFQGGASGLNPVASWSREEFRPCAQLGTSIVSGDFSGDGGSFVAVGAPIATELNQTIKCKGPWTYGVGPIGDTTNGLNNEVLVFRGSVSGLTQTATIRPYSQFFPGGPNRSRGAGFSLATVQPAGRGSDRLVIGAPFFAINLTAGPITNQRGAVYLASSSNGGTSFVTPALVSEPAIFQGDENQRLGKSVANAHDVNGDGREDILVGLSGWRVVDDAGSYRGRVALYLGTNDGGFGAPLSDGGVAPDWEWSPDVAFAGAGNRVVGVGDIDDDGYDDVAVAAPYIGRGRVYVFQGSASGLPNQPSFAIDGTVGKGFGLDLAGVGDVNGDGLADIAMGNVRGEFNWVTLPDGGIRTAGLTNAAVHRKVQIFYGCSLQWGRDGGGVCPGVLPPDAGSSDGGVDAGVDAGTSACSGAVRFLGRPLNLTSLGLEYQYSGNSKAIPLSNPCAEVTSLPVGDAGVVPMVSFPGCPGPACSMQWQPTAEGVYPFRLMARDPLPPNSTDIQFFEVRVVGTPRINRMVTPPLTGMVNTPFTFVPEATGTRPLVWSLNPLVYGPLADSSSGALTWVPSTPGTYSLAYTVRNAFGEDRHTFPTITIGMPVQAQITGTPNLTALLNTRYRYDADGKVDVTPASALVYVKSGPTDFRVDPVSRDVMWLPRAVGPQTITLVAGTPPNQSNDFTFTVNVIDVPPAPPTAVGVAEEQPGDTFTVRLNSAGSAAAPGRSLALIEWDPGDGTPPKYEAAPLVTYATPVGVNAELTVTDDYGQTASVLVPVRPTVDGVKAPLAEIEVTATRRVGNGASIDFNCKCTDDANRPLTFLWKFGDGEVPSTSTLQAPTMEYLKPGVYNVTVLVGNGVVQTLARRSVQVKGPNGELPPEVRIFAKPVRGLAPLSVEFSSIARDFDGVIVNREWRFENNLLVNRVDVTHIFEAPGLYTVFFSATDSSGLTSRTSVDIEVLDAAGNSPPVFVTHGSLTATVGTPYLYDVRGDTFTPQLRGTKPYTFGLGVQEAGELVGVPAGATVDTSTGKISWVPRDVGSYRLELTATNVTQVVARDSMVVKVEPAQCSSGCCCTSLPGGSSAALLGLLVLLLASRRRLS